MEFGVKVLVLIYKKLFKTTLLKYGFWYVSANLNKKRNKIDLDSKELKAFHEKITTNRDLIR